MIESTLSTLLSNIKPDNRRVLNLLHLCIYSFAVVVSISELDGGTTGKLEGKITDSSNDSPLIGVNVIINNTGMGAASDQNGYYSVINIPPGKVSVSFNMIGYKILTVTDILIKTDHTTAINANLNFTVIESDETVEVIATRPVIEMDRTSTESTVSGDEIDLLPVQTVEDVLNLQAGVIGGHFRGGRSQEVGYLIDGVPVNDVFSSGAALLLENDVIQELKVISGTFNAEYGQAQSGIVEIITRNGGINFTSNLDITIGDHVSNNKSIFRNIDEISPKTYNDYSLTLSGPLPFRTGFLINYKSTTDDGYLYGRDFFQPSVLDGEVAFGDTLGFIPMADYARNSFFGKISIPLTSKDKISINMTSQNKENSVYEHMFQYNPRGNSRVSNNSNILYLTWNHLFNQKAFMNFSASYSHQDYSRFLFDDKYDNRYSTDSRLTTHGNFSFYTGGTDLRYFSRETNSTIFKSSLTWQISRILQLKTGLELNKHDLKLHDIVLKKNQETGFQIQVPPEKTADNQQYQMYPVENAAFMQFKLETKGLILNSGIRIDYFDSKGELISDFTRPNTSEKIPADSDFQLSPRFGIAYPISDRGVMHVSYGHFFQIPPFEVLYTNPNFVINPEGGRANVLNFPFGNANLQPQKTVAYEIGFQQQLSQLLSFEATAYYKDIRNLLGTEINTVATGELHSGIDYGRYVNRDYGQVQGFTLMIDKLLSNGIGGSVDYTYQVARGNASDPKSVLIDNQSEPPVESEKQLLPLDWDQTHTINGRLSLEPAKGVVMTLIGKYGSGMPYTPSKIISNSVIENSDRKPPVLSFDLFMMKHMTIGNVAVQLKLTIYNVFDRLNELNVYSDSGRASYTEELNQPGVVQGWNTKEEFFLHPEWYTPPRQILAGLSINF